MAIRWLIASAWLALGGLRAADAMAEVPRSLECPPPLEFREGPWPVDLHPDPGGAGIGNQCRRADGVRQGPAIAWWFGRSKLAQIGFYCDGEAEGRWSFFWRNGVLAREGEFAAASRRHGTWTDWDEKGRRLRETDYSNGKEVARRDFIPPGPAVEPDPTMVDAAAAKRYEEVVRQACSAVPAAPRPYRGLRAELNAAEAVLRIRVTGTQALDLPPGWDWTLGPPPRQQVDALVHKVLAGSLAQAGEPVRLFLAARQHLERSQVLPRYSSEIAFWSGPQTDQDQTALVKREGGRLVLLTLMGVDDRNFTDALLAEYARAARLDDGAFTLALARLIADRVRLAPDRLLWAGWGPHAFDDWDRLKVSLPTADPALRLLASETQKAVVAQIDAVVRGGQDGVNLYELPWLIRLLPRQERRELAAALLRLHPMIAAHVAKETKATQRPPGTGESTELSMDLVRRQFAYLGFAELVECLALCVDPEAPLRVRSPAAQEEALRRARAFAR